MADKEIILPCPFCGELPKIEEEEWVGDSLVKGVYVECVNDNCFCEPRTYHLKNETRNKVINDWNTRIDNPRKF